MPSLVSDYSGPTGAIFHRRHTIEGSTPERGASRYEEEAWFEIGGDHRTHAISTYGPINAAGSYLSSGVTENWSTPMFEVNLQSGTTYSPTTPGSYARVGCPTQREAFRPSHGDLALWEFDRVKRIYDRYLAGEQLPAGPDIDGHQTVTGDIHPSDQLTQTMIIDRETGALRRIVNSEPNGQQTTINYSAWEMIPAGGPAATLSGVIPATGLPIRAPRGCEQIAPFAPGTP